MSNTVDFFQPEYTRLALPAATTMVFVDGVLCEELEPVEIVRSGWPEFGQARLAYNPAAALTPKLLDPEQVEDRFGPGRAISLRQVYNAIPPDTAVASLPVFVGLIERVETCIGPETETVETARKAGQAGEAERAGEAEEAGEAEKAGEAERAGKTAPRAGVEKQALAEWILADRLPVRLNLQLHTWIWGPGARGV